MSPASSLDQLLGGYFYLYWEKEFETRAEAVAAYVDNVGNEEARRALAEVRDLLKQDDGAIQSLFASNFGGYASQPEYARAFAIELEQLLSDRCS